MSDFDIVQKDGIYMDRKPLKIGDLTARIPVIQGGMGVGISLSHLAGSHGGNKGKGQGHAGRIGKVRPAQVLFFLLALRRRRRGRRRGDLFSGFQNARFCFRLGHGTPSKRTGDARAERARRQRRERGGYWPFLVGSSKR